MQEIANKEANYRTVIDMWRQVAIFTARVNSFSSGFLDEVDINKLDGASFPLLYVEPSTSTLDTGTLTFSFNVYMLDQVPDAIVPSTEIVPFSVYDTEKQNRGREDVFSHTLNILKTVITSFKQNLFAVEYPGTSIEGERGSPVGTDYILTTPISMEPFTARFNNLLTGWSCQIEVQATNTNDLCAAPTIGFVQKNKLGVDEQSDPTT